MTNLSTLNLTDRDGFVAVCGPLFEHSPWIAQRAWEARPFASLDELHSVLCSVVEASDVNEKLALIRAHPDLVGSLARQGQLTRESTSEQAAAGLAELSPDEAAAFDRYNAAYRERFGFPFIICARQNKKEAILAAFPIRLAHEQDEEMGTAIGEIFKIARLRLYDAVSESA
jgi:OHCU decarboxylase